MKTKTQMMENLLKNKDFKELFLDSYLGSDITDIVLTNDISVPEVNLQLKARTIFKQYIEQMLDYDIIQSIKS